MRFQDRNEAGRELARRLRDGRPGAGPAAGPPPAAVVLGLPRGGVPVAYEVARALGAPLDVLLVRKIGHPRHPEYGLGAVAGDAPPLYDPDALAGAGLTEDDLAPAAERERAELRRREAVYRGGRPAPALAGRWAVVVDDGLATGATARAALRAARAAGPARLTLAVPVASPGGLRTVRSEADDVTCLHTPGEFGAVGLWYDDFEQLTDADVLELLGTG
ncbi:phosphoribosyltransferase family protein [Streptomyces sp. WMMC500]|uniref:phosphoribosyltransferase n=1 Tax=Streptomyces sp. WMMC500 TaxID=3015154 RepID=UPI00248B08B2|nr:phosphoribosyltransferase family protein [Streptomyces sp. WMMC500]WBB61348.1 phosphoribosyltransferase family protein [Streptomyces sp. WMMC500]